MLQSLNVHFHTRRWAVFKWISFQFSDVHSDTTDNLYYQLLRERKENLLTNRMPYNGFEEMIKLTNEGKMWHYPIDNEQGANINLSTSVQKHSFFFFLFAWSMQKQSSLRKKSHLWSKCKWRKNIFSLSLIFMTKHLN